MRRPMTFRTHRGPTDRDEEGLSGVEVDGEMGAACKRARHHLEHEHDTAGGGEKAASQSRKAPIDIMGYRIVPATRNEQLHPARLAFC